LPQGLPAIGIELHECWVFKLSAEPERLKLVHRVSIGMTTLIVASEVEIPGRSWTKEPSLDERYG
jgi:hypothetical protein